MEGGRRLSDLISREKAVETAKQFWYKPDVANALSELPSADIMECARAIKEYCVNRVSHNPTMCDSCPIYKVMCEPDISCPYHWDLPEGEKGGSDDNT